MYKYEWFLWGKDTWMVEERVRVWVEGRFLLASLRAVCKGPSISNIWPRQEFVSDFGLFIWKCFFQSYMCWSIDQLMTLRFQIKVRMWTIDVIIDLKSILWIWVNECELSILYGITMSEFGRKTLNKLCKQNSTHKLKNIDVVNIGI